MMAYACPELTQVHLKRRVIRNAGVASLVKMAKNSKELNLGQCVAITDHALEAIGYFSSCLESAGLFLH